METIGGNTSPGRPLGEESRRLAFVVGCLAVVGCDAAISTGPRNPVGTVTVTVRTTGVEMDGDGYQVRIGDGEARSVPVNGTVTFVDVPAERHTLALEDLALTCDVEGGELRHIDVTANEALPVMVAVRCTAKPVVFTKGDWHVYRMNADGTGARRIGPTGPDPVWSRGWDPRWSPDGSRILFTYQEGWGTSAELYVMNADGSAARRLTGGSSGSWSPDGGRIAFSRSVENTWAESGIYVMQANGGGVTRLTDRFGDSPDWGPDGRIVFNEWELDAEGAPHGGWLSVTDGEGGVVTRLLEGGVLRPAWSPDGSRIAFSRRDGEGYTVYTVGAGGQGLKRRTATSESESQPRWSPDGETLIFTTYHDSDQSSDVRMGSPDGGPSTPISLFVVDDRSADIRRTH